MVARVVRACAILVMLVGFNLAWSSAAWSQACSLAVPTTPTTSACLSPGNACGSTTGGVSGTCKTGQRTGTEFNCNCVDSAGGLVSGGQPVPTPTPTTPVPAGWSPLSFLVVAALLAAWGAFEILRKRRTSRPQRIA